MTADLKSDYTLIKERVHACERCGHDMRMLSDRSAGRAALKCPDCGGKLERDPYDIKWD